MPDDTSGTSRYRGGAGLVLGLLAFAQLIVSIDYNIVYVALPRIGAGLGFSPQTMQLVISAYAVAFGGFLLFGGRASDVLGRRRMFVSGLCLYAVASLAGGLAGDPALLVAARAVQGVGGAVLFPATLALVSTSFAEGRERNRAFSIWAATGGAGMVLGSLLGGLLTQALGWRSVFFVNVPLAVTGAAAAFALIPADPARVRGRRFDVPGALAATGGVTLVLAALVEGPGSGWTSPGILASVAAGAALLAAFVAIEARSADALIPLRMFTSRNLSVGFATTFLFMATFGTLLYFLTVYYQQVHGYSALRTGLAFLIPMAAIIIGSNAGGRIMTRVGVRATITASLLLGAVGTLLLGLELPAGGHYWSLIPGLVILSLGQGVIYTAMFAAAGTGIAAGAQGIASGIVSTGQQIGGALGLAVLVAIANSSTAGVHGRALAAAATHGIRVAVFVIAAGMAAMILIALGFAPPARTPAPAGTAQPLRAATR